MRGARAESERNVMHTNIIRTCDDADVADDDALFWWCVTVVVLCVAFLFRICVTKRTCGILQSA